MTPLLPASAPAYAINHLHILLASGIHHQSQESSVQVPQYTCSAAYERNWPFVQDGMAECMTASGAAANEDAMPDAAAPQQEEDHAELAPILEAERPVTRRARAALQQATFVSTVPSLPASRRTRSNAPVPAPTLEMMEKFLHTLLADPLKEARVMGSNYKLLASRVAGEAIAESDIDVPSFMASYDQVQDVQAVQFLMECQGAFRPCGRVQLKELLKMIQITGNCSSS